MNVPCCLTSAFLLIAMVAVASAEDARSAPSESSAVPRRMFYVDSESGRDGNDGLSPDTPWQSLERANSADLLPGDTVQFKRGGVWRGSLTPVSGATDAPVTYRSYGQGEKPLLFGSRPRNQPEDWVHVEEGIWATLPLTYQRVEQLRDIRRSHWTYHQEAGAQVEMGQRETDDGTVIQVTCSQNGEQSNHIQLWGPAAPVEKGAFLELSFRARSSIPFKLSGMEFMRGSPPWRRLAAASVNRQLTPQWQDFETVFPVSESSTDAKLHISLGGSLPEGAVLEFLPESLYIVTPNVLDPLDVDVGNLIFDHGEVCGWKKWSIESLDNPYDYFYDSMSQRVFLRLAVNPATRHNSIECAMKRHVINQSNVHDVVYDGLAVMYGAAHGFGGGNTDHIVIRHCELGYIGGGHQLTRPDGHPVRFGNAIEFWGAASNHLVENCRIWQVYDAALTNQNTGASVRQENIVYRNNIIWNCEYSFEYWNHPETSVTRNIQFVNNTCVHAGSVWSHEQRPDPNGSHLMFYSNTADISELEVKYNIFYQVSDWGSRYTGGWKSLPRISYNVWFSDRGIMANWFGERLDTFPRYQSRTGLDVHSVFADPKFVDAARGDYRPAPDSPTRILRPDGGPVGAEELWEDGP